MKGKGSVIYKCEWCGEGFLGPPSRAKAKHICCCKKCESGFRKSQSEKNCTCPICGKSFHVKPRDKKDVNYCSIQCLNIARSDWMKGNNNHQYGLKGNLNSSWKSDEKITSYGYRMIRVIDHPFRNSDDFVFEHRLVAEKYLLTEENSIEINGRRYLRKEYAVHHIDQNKLNNNVENLVVLTKAEHIALHNKLKEIKRDEKTGQFMSGK